MTEEKELTIEEMKSLVTLSTLLPALLSKIESIEKQINELKSSFVNIATKFSDNAKVVESYKKSVDELIDGQADAGKILSDLEVIKTIVKTNAAMNIANTTLAVEEKPKKATPAQQTQPAPKPTKKKEEQALKKKSNDKVIEIVDKILADRRGRKMRALTNIDVKKGFKCDDETADAVLKWLEKNGMYSSKTHTLTYPKG